MVVCTASIRVMGDARGIGVSCEERSRRQQSRSCGVRDDLFGRRLAWTLLGAGEATGCHTRHGNVGRSGEPGGRSGAGGRTTGLLR